MNSGDTQAFSSVLSKVAALALVIMSTSQPAVREKRGETECPFTLNILSRSCTPHFYLHPQVTSTYIPKLQYKLELVCMPTPRCKGGWDLESSAGWPRHKFRELLLRKKGRVDTGGQQAASVINACVGWGGPAVGRVRVECILATVLA